MISPYPLHVSRHMPQLPWSQARMTGKMPTNYQFHKITIWVGQNQVGKVNHFGWLGFILGYVCQMTLLREVESLSRVLILVTNWYEIWMICIHASLSWNNSEYFFICKDKHSIVLNHTWICLEVLCDSKACMQSKYYPALLLFLICILIFSAVEENKMIWLWMRLVSKSYS